MGGRSIKTTTTPEGAVLKACLAALDVYRVPHWRANTGAAMLPGKGGKRRPVRFGPKGQSDILGLVPRSGRLLAVECKRDAKAPVSDDQRAFLSAVRDAGGVALLVWDARKLVLALGRLARDPWARLGLDGEIDDTETENDI